MPLGGIGVVFYGALAILIMLALLAGPQTRAAAGALVLLALTLALAADVALFGIQLVAIRAFCKLCMLTYAVNALALVLALPARRDGRVVGEALLRSDGRLAFTGWAVATVLLGTGVVAAESALDHRERDRVAGLLGAPPTAPAATPAAAPLASPAPGSDAARFQEEARVATEQARRLQEILDDPRKLEQYFAEKAAREFEQGPVHPLKLEGTAYKGPAQAPIRVVEFSDFLCPFCKNIAGAFASYLPASAGRVSVYFKNYPLDSECNPNVGELDPSRRLPSGARRRSARTSRDGSGRTTTGCSSGIRSRARRRRTSPASPARRGSTAPLSRPAWRARASRRSSRPRSPRPGRAASTGRPRCS